MFKYKSILNCKMKSVWIALSIFLLILVQPGELKDPGHESLEHLDIWHECIHDKVQYPLFIKLHVNNTSFFTAKIYNAIIIYSHYLCYCFV